MGISTLYTRGLVVDESGPVHTSRPEQLLGQANHMYFVPCRAIAPKKSMRVISLVDLTPAASDAKYERALGLRADDQ